ncbi:MAG: TIR domain-containing protein [Actinomycetota bacterium]|nr:TIR domain-containing protein [Actinomycetota bacterium]
MTTSGIFISYRRDDSAGHAGRLYDKLSEGFGADQIFMDIDTIDPGHDFIEVIDRALASSKVVIALIGRRWTTATDSAGRKRLENPQDFVRMEVARSLETGIRVIPVLVQGATMPGPDELPADLTALTRRHAIELSDVRWQYDVGRLTTAIEESLGRPPRDGTSREGVTLGATSGPTTRKKGSLAGLRRVPMALIAIALLAAVVGVVAFTLRSGGDEEDRPAAAAGGSVSAEEGVVAFVSDTSGSCEIHVIEPDGSGEAQLTDSGAANLRPDWSPDGSQLVYVSNRDGDSAIFTFDVANDEEKELLNHPGIERGPDWSPDGRRIAFSSILEGASEIWVLDDVAGREAVQITDDGVHNVAPDWSPDGGSIAYASDIDDDSDIFVMNADGTGRRNVTGDLFEGAPSNEFDPQWSPDGSLISFESLRQGEDFDIWTITPEGTGTENLTAHSDNDRHSSWSPSGNKIVFGSDRRVPGDDAETGCSTDEGQRDLFVMNADGTGQRRLTRIEADDSAPAWSPP